MTYLNTSMFMLAMIPTLLRTAHRRHRKYGGDLYKMMRCTVSRKDYRRRYDQDGDIVEPEEAEAEEAEALIGPGKPPSSAGVGNVEEEKDKYLGIVPTARLALMLCILWFGANYLAMACLQYTTVASTTILTSTSSFWTLLIGAFTGTEKFTWRKLCGVFGSLIGVILISRADLGADTNNNDNDNNGAAAAAAAAAAAVVRSVKRVDTFPDKSPSELALGDALALMSAIIYGVYTITLKKTTVKALPRSLNMPLFFGLVGVCNAVLLFPLFPILHFSGLERFTLPPSQRVWTILLVNSVSSLLSDICWAYAMVLTSPLLVTVGLSLTIPLSLVGEMVLQGHYEGWVYWLGAAIVVASFVFVDHEEREEEEVVVLEEEGGEQTVVGEPRHRETGLLFSDDDEQPSAAVP